MIVPTIGLKGFFEFSTPFNTDEYNKKLEVTAIRSILDFYNNGEDPLNNIYLRSGLTSEQYEEDINNDVFICVLKTTGNKVYYIPCNKILSLPKTSGVEYKQKVITVNLGMLPNQFDLARISSDIGDLVKDSIGIKPGVSIVETSDICYKTEDEHKNFMSIFDRNPKIQLYDSYKNKYLKLSNDFQSLEENYNNLLDFLSNNAGSVIEGSNRPTAEDLVTYTKYIKIEMVSETLKKPMGLNRLLFIRYNKFNKTSRPAYAKGFSSVISTGTNYKLLLDKVSGSFELKEGELDNSHMPYVFSDYFNCIFKPGLATIMITLDDLINIRQYKLKPWSDENTYCDKIRVTLYNQNSNPINTRTFVNGIDFNRSGTGVDSEIDTNELTLKEMHNQEQPFPLPPEE